MLATRHAPDIDTAAHEDARLIKEIFALMEPVADKAAAYFYGRLFAENPRLRALFPPAMDIQRDRLFHALSRLVWVSDSPETLEAHFAELGRDHRKFGVAAEHYQAFGRALLATMRKFAGEAWTTEMERAWIDAYTRVATAMMKAMARDAAHAPAYWKAEVVDHELRTPDIAVITVRPDQSFSYRAGQYVKVMTARWPRVWRPYSMACAPRDDGLVKFHVKAVPGGWVSSALVRHTKIGDVILHGAALGSMTLDTDSDRDILCVAGGTGLGPIKALIEEVATLDRHRNVKLLFGVRRPQELYDLPDLDRMQGQHPWLRVIPVVSDDPTYDSMHGTLPEVVGRFQGLDERDVYVSGPTPMVRATVTRLQALGVPLAQIRHDVFESSSWESGD